MFSFLALDVVLGAGKILKKGSVHVGARILEAEQGFFPALVLVNCVTLGNTLAGLDVLLAV